MKVAKTNIYLATKLENMNRNYLLSFLLLVFSGWASAQMTAQFSTSPNMNCLGQPCNYQGPSILINELMISPTSNDGSISGPGGVSAGRGEWIELYNPNLCEPVDISCFYLGNWTSEGQGGVRLPSNLIVPPGGFALIRGINAAPVPSNLLVQNGGNVVEVVVPGNITDNGVCCTGTRVWFPNAGGWFAFYDTNGVPQDAVSWGSAAGVNGQPCSASRTGCPGTTPLVSYNNIPSDRKAFASPLNAGDHLGNSIRRIPDGGAWSGNGTPTYAVCNSLPCAVVGESTCTGMATITVSGGQPPYSYVWNDSQAQLTQTANGLCSGAYQVTVTDNNNNSQIFAVNIQDFVPTVSLNVANSYCADDAAVNLTGFSPIPQANESGTLSGNGITTTTFSPNGAGVGTHTITYTFVDAGGCTNSATDQITVNPMPNVTLTAAGEYCSQDPVVAINNLSPAPTSGGVGSLTGAGISGFTFNPSVAGPGTHTITYTFTTTNGCVNTATDDIVVNLSPNVTLNAAAQYCAYDPAVVIDNLSPAPSSGGTGTLTGPGVTGFEFNPNLAGPGTHTLTYNFVSTNGCTNSATDQIVVHPIPNVTLNASGQYCTNDPAIAISSLTPSPFSGGVGNLTGPGIADFVFNPSVAGPGTHTLTYTFTSIYGCVNSASDDVVVYQSPSVSFSGEPTSGFEPLEVVFTNTSNGASNFQWNFGDGNSASTGFTNYTHVFDEYGNYTVILIGTENGCSDTASLLIQVFINPISFDIPNVFTPNGDNTNPFFNLINPIGFNRVEAFEALILNRWGHLIRTFVDYDFGWDGTDENGNAMVEGVYFYKIYIRSVVGEVFENHGFVHLVRE
jgi:gliding motility-associated-like protein